jgi:hypothetical protein
MKMLCLHAEIPRTSVQYLVAPSSKFKLKLNICQQNRGIFSPKHCMMVPCVDSPISESDNEQASPNIKPWPEPESLRRAQPAISVGLGPGKLSWAFYVHQWQSSNNGKVRFRMGRV